MQIAGTPPIDWGGHAVRSAERRNQKDAGASVIAPATSRRGRRPGTSRRPGIRRPVTGDTGAVDEAGTGETVVVDAPDVTVPVVPPEATDPVELLDVMITGVPADE